MISGTLIALAVVALTLLVILFKKKNDWSKTLKGPRGMPFFGNALQIEKLQHLTFAKWAKEFGPIFKINLLTTRVVIISDHNYAKEIFSDPGFTGRFDATLFNLAGAGKINGVISTEGSVWEEMRRFALRNLRDLGLGKTSMEDLILLEVNELTDGLAQTVDKPLANVKERLLLAVVNSLWSIVTSKRYKQDDKALLDLTHKAHMVFDEIAGTSGVLLLVPWVAKSFPALSGYNKIRKIIDEFSSNFNPPVNEHMDSYNENYQRDFIDVFINEIKKTTDPKSGFYGKTGVENLLGVLIDLYVAGTDTTGAALTWMMLYLSKFSEKQKKIQEEIDFVVGVDRKCGLADRPNMPYSEAVIAEVLRISSHIPLGLFHKATKDTMFRGHLIPKDTIVSANLWDIHHNEKIWGDPDTFRPERFLSLDGKTFKKHEGFIPFSVGRRQCLGEALARDSLFLFATNIFQRFRIEFDPNGPDHGFEPSFGFITTPKQFNIILRDRHN